jgi:transposase
MPTIGIDLGDKYSHFCVLPAVGDHPVEQGKVRSTAVALEDFLHSHQASLIVIEACTLSHWVSGMILAAGHDLIVANSRKVGLIYKNSRKCDERDAEILARLGRADPKLLSPVQLRRPETQQALALLKCRDALVSTRTDLVNTVRSQAKAIGARIGKCSTKCFEKKARADLPDQLLQLLGPILDSVELISQRIRGYEKRIEELSKKEYPEIALLQQVNGVGPITATAFLLTIEEASRFSKSRDVAAYLGLVTRRDQSGCCDKQLGITKEGDALVRRLLVQAAQYILGPFGADSDLRRWGLALVDRGGKAAKKRAVVAVARKLAVLLHALWKTGEVYEPLRNSSQQELIAAA